MYLNGTKSDPMNEINITKNDYICLIDIKTQILVGSLCNCRVTRWRLGDVIVLYKKSLARAHKDVAVEILVELNIVETEDSVETEKLIKMVSEGDIDFTVADESVALVNASYYSNIDVFTPVSFSQQIAWRLGIMPIPYLRN